jgi:hypothetical protein
MLITPTQFSVFFHPNSDIKAAGAQLNDMLLALFVMELIFRVLYTVLENTAFLW